EVNANFHRLDLNDIHCRKAREMGVHVIISTDSHNYDDMLNLPYGVATAQRGWIEKDRVLNVKPVEEMLNFKKKFRLRTPSKLKIRRTLSVLILWEYLRSAPSVKLRFIRNGLKGDMPARCDTLNGRKG